MLTSPTVNLASKNARMSKVMKGFVQK